MVCSQGLYDIKFCHFICNRIGNILPSFCLNELTLLIFSWHNVDLASEPGEKL